MEKEKSGAGNSSEVSANLRDLIVHLHRGNGGLAETIVNQVAYRLKDIMQSGLDPQSSPMLRAQQTLFAIDEVQTLLSQRDFNGAMDAARDAAKEWKYRSASDSA